MKRLFIEARSTEPILQVVKKAVNLLPKKIGLVTTVQYKHRLKEANEFLEKNKKTAVIAGVVLGCDVSSAKRIAKKVDAFLYIGSGEFHPLGIALETNKPVIVANPLSNEVSRIKKEDVEQIRKRRKGAYLKFLTARNIGIIVSTKPGQSKLKQALELKKKLKNKNCCIFIADEIDLNQLENFPFIECWVNTACPRIADKAKGMINVEEVMRTK